MSNVDMGFVKFVKKKKHIKKKENSEEEDYNDDILLGRKHENEPFNNIKPNKIKKDYSSEDEKEKKLSSEEDYESESDDYAEEKLNHYIGNKFKDDDENEMKETLNEIKRKIKRENINKEEEEEEEKEEEEEEEKGEEEEENDEEDN